MSASDFCDEMSKELSALEVIVLLFHTRGALRVMVAMVFMLSFPSLEIYW